MTELDTPASLDALIAELRKAKDVNKEIEAAYNKLNEHFNIVKADLAKRGFMVKPLEWIVAKIPDNQVTTGKITGFEKHNDTPKELLGESSLDQLIAELRQIIYSEDIHLQRALDALEALRAQRDELFAFYNPQGDRTIHASRDAAIARVLKGEKP